MLHTGILFTNKEWVSKGTASWSCVKISLSTILQNLHLRERRRMKLEKGKDTYVQENKKRKREEGQPLSVSGQRDVSIILQRQISSKQFPPATGDQGADEK